MDASPCKNYSVGVRRCNGRTVAQTIVNSNYAQTKGWHSKSRPTHSLRHQPFVDTASMQSSVYSQASIIGLIERVHRRT